MAGKYDDEIRRKALAGIALTNPTKESQALYDSYKTQKSQPTQTKTTTQATGSQGVTAYGDTKQGKTGQVQYSPYGTFTAAPTPSNIQLTEGMVKEIQNKAANGMPLTNWSAQKQELYNAFKNPAPQYIDYNPGSAPTYSSQYTGQIDQALNELLNKSGNFSYNYENDPLWQQYKESYQREGDRGLENAMAQATALTGGRMNSNAMMVGQQAQNYYNSQMNDKIPELQQIAYKQYLDELTNARNNVNTLQNVEAQNYAKYQDQLAQFNTDREFGYRQTQDKNNYNYQNYRDTQNYDRSVLESDRNYDYNLWQNQNALAQDKRNFDYQVGRDAVADSQWQKNFDEQRNQFNQQLAYNKERAAVSDRQWQQQFDYGKTRDAKADEQWNREMGYRTGRDIVSDNQWERSFQEQQRQNEINNTLNAIKAANSNSGTNRSGYNFTDYAKQVSTQLSNAYKNSDPQERAAMIQKVKDSIMLWVDSGYITEEEGLQIYRMNGLE